MANRNVIVGTLGDDSLFGGNQPDDIFGDVQNSLTAVGNGISLVSGSDLLDGANQHDRLYGDAGLDLLVDGSGSTVRGGNDDLIGGNGKDELYGDAGRDRLGASAAACPWRQRWRSRSRPGP